MCAQNSHVPLSMPLGVVAVRFSQLVTALTLLGPECQFWAQWLGQAIKYGYRPHRKKLQPSVGTFS